jgi:hypothetical protein
MMRVLVVGALLLLTAGVLGAIVAVVAGSGSAWALVGFALVLGSLIGWRAKLQVNQVRRSAPEEALTRRDLVRYASIAVGVAGLIVAVAAVASAVS